MQRAIDELRGGRALRQSPSSLTLPGARTIAFLLGVSIALAVCSSPARADDPTLEDISRALQEWKRSWVTLRFTYEERNPVMLRRWAKDPKIREAESVDDYFFLVTWSLAADGSHRFEHLRFEDGPFVGSAIKAWRARDSLHFEALVHPNSDGAEVLTQLTVTTYNPPAPSAEPKTAQMLLQRNTQPLHALYNLAGGEWIGESLAHGFGDLEAFEELDGVRCARVRVNKVVFWFDIAHGFLPRRSDDPNDDWSATEFQQLSNGTWFPKSGTQRAKPDAPDEVYNWNVIDVAVNEPLDTGLFDPPTPVVGTMVRDHRNGKFYTVQDTKAGFPTPAQSGADAKIDPVPDILPVADRSSVAADITFWDRYQWPGMLLVAAIAVLMIGIWLSRRA